MNDLDAARRAHLAQVEAFLGTLPVTLAVRYRALETPGPGAITADPPAGVNGLVAEAPPWRRSVNGLAQVAAATVVDERDWYEAWGGRLTRDRSLVYEPFPSRGRRVYCLFLLEDPWEARGHDRWSPPARICQSEDRAEIAAELAAWADEPLVSPGALAADARAQLGRLRQQLEARQADLDRVAVITEVDHDHLSQAAGDADAVERDLEHLSRGRLVWNFPRDRRGRLQPRALVALASYGSPENPQSRQLWLCAEGPTGIREPQEIRLRLRWEHGDNQDHRWDGARWLWDARSQQPELATRWCIDDRSRADRSTALMEAGRFREGLDLYGVRLSPEVESVVEGRVPWYELRALAGRWQTALCEQLAPVAPWLLASAATIGRRPLRVFGLGGQSIARKPGLYLAATSDGPRLEIHWSASNARLPLVAWRRPIDYDLVRLGLIDEAELARVAAER